MQEIPTDKEIWIVTSEGDPSSPTTLFDFIEMNNREEFGPMIYTDQELAYMRALEVGEEYIFNMGAGGLFKVKRVEAPAPQPPRRSVKDYLGDSVYVDVNPYGSIVLTTENGLGPSNTIVMEDSVVTAFFHYLERVKGIKITIER